MANEIESFRFIAHDGEVGHSVVIGRIAAGKSVAELVEALGTGHP